MLIEILFIYFEKEKERKKEIEKIQLISEL